MLLCTACESNGGGVEPPATDESAYLVMFYGAGGGSLDVSIISNIFQALDESAEPIDVARGA